MQRLFHLFLQIKIRIYRVSTKKKYSKKTQPVVEVLARDFRILRPRRKMRPILLFSQPPTRAHARRSRRLVLRWRRLFRRCVESVSGEPTTVCFCLLYFCCIVRLTCTKITAYLQDPAAVDSSRLFAQSSAAAPGAGTGHTAHAAA